MSSNTANMIVFVLMVLLPLAAVLALEVFLSRRPSLVAGARAAVLGDTRRFNMIRLRALNFLLAQPTLGGGILHAGLFTLACLVPSAALFAIYFLNRKKVQQKCAETENGKPQK